LVLALAHLGAARGNIRRRPFPQPRIDFIFSVADDARGERDERRPIILRSADFQKLDRYAEPQRGLRGGQQQIGVTIDRA
jgi:hypothetical protein